MVSTLVQKPGLVALLSGCYGFLRVTEFDRARSFMVLHTDLEIHHRVCKDFDLLVLI